MEPASSEPVVKFVKAVVGNRSHVDQIIQTKLKEKVALLDNLKSDSTIKLAQKQEKKRRRKVMPARERKARKLFEIPEDKRRFELYMPLHELWKNYMAEVIGNNPANAVQRLLKADYNGCLLKVTQSKCPSFLGVSGIVAQETTNTFKIITPDDTQKVVPKQGTVFTFQLGAHVITLYGNNFIYRSVDRTSRRFKSKSTIEL